MELDHISCQKKCVLSTKTGNLAKHSSSRIINAVEEVINVNKGEVECWKCGQKGHMKRNCKRKGGMTILAIFNETKFRETRKLKPCRSLWGEYMICLYLKLSLKVIQVLV